MTLSIVHPNFQAEVYTSFFYVYGKNFFTPREYLCSNEQAMIMI